MQVYFCFRRNLMAKGKKSAFLTEFKAFIMRGSVIDMAVGIVIGGAFTAIVQSFVGDILNPVIGLIVGKVDFSDLKVVLSAATATTGEVAIRYGMLIQKIVQFILTALVLFLVIKGFNKIKALDEAAKAKQEAAKAPVEPPKPVTPPDIALLTEIRDLLKKH